MERIEGGRKGSKAINRKKKKPRYKQQREKSVIRKDRGGCGAVLGFRLCLFLLRKSCDS